MLDDQRLRQFLETKAGKAIYVACVTLTLTSGSWAVLVHQDSVKDRNSMINERFAKEAAKAGLAEIKLGKLAEGKGSSETVKNFGSKMVADHSKAAEELAAAAKKENLTLPSELSPKDQATYDKLSNLSGAEFDRAYAREMVRDHQADLAAFQREANTGKDDAIKNVASQTVPMIQEHLNQAKEMLNSVPARAAKKTERNARRIRQGR